LGAQLLAVLIKRIAIAVAVICEKALECRFKIKILAVISQICLLSARRSFLSSCYWLAFSANLHR